MSILFLLRLCPCLPFVVGKYIAVRRDQKAARSGCRVLDYIAQVGPHDLDHAVDQGTRREILPRAGFLLVRVLLQQSLIEIAQTLMPRTVPVQFIYLADERRQRRWFFDERTGISVNLLHERRFCAAQFQQRALVEIQPFERGFRCQVLPAIAFREQTFRVCLLGHLEEEQVSQFGDVLMIGHPIIFEDIAEVP